MELRHTHQVNFISLEGSGTQILRSIWDFLAWRKGGSAGTLSLPNHLKGSCSNVRVGLLSKVTEQGERASSCTRGDLSWILENFFTENIVKYQNSLPREVEESPSPETFKRHVDVTFRDMV